MKKPVRTKRSTSVPKFALGAGLIAASAAVAVPMANTQANSVDDGFVASISQDADASVTPGDRTAGASVTISIDEEWNAARHGPELNKLIVKKAKQMGRLSDEERILLSTLQKMRRASLPQSISYEEFIRERKRLEDLAKVMDAMAEYKRKYCAS